MARICVVRQYYFPLDTRVRREVDALEKAGHDVTVVCLRSPGQPRRERRGGVTVLRMPLRHRRGQVARYLFEHAAFLAMAAATVAALHLRRPWDVVQVNTMPDTLVFAALVPRLLGARVLLDLQECMPECFATTFAVPPAGAAVRTLGRLEQLSIRVSHRALTCTELMRDVFVGRGTPEEKISVVLNGSDEDVFDPRKHQPPDGHDPERFVLVSHGTVEPRYGLDTGIRAVALLRDEIPGLKLEIYGEGTQLEELRRLAERLDVVDRVWFSGRFVPLVELVEAIARADAGLVAVRRDPYRDLTLCNKMYDFVTMQKPAIVSRTRSVEVCFGDSCFQLFNSGDEHDLARAIRQLHGDPGLRERLVRRATEANRSHRWAEQRKVYLDVVDQLLHARQLAPAR
jgi:glycosyltransferase involved in cell wall biosynthesis